MLSFFLIATVSSRSICHPYDSLKTTADIRNQICDLHIGLTKNPQLRWIGGAEREHTLEQPRGWLWIHSKAGAVFAQKFHLHRFQIHQWKIQNQQSAIGWDFRWHFRCHRKWHFGWHFKWNFKTYLINSVLGTPAGSGCVRYGSQFRWQTLLTQQPH